jgi:hypothetical protein
MRRILNQSGNAAVKQKGGPVVRIDVGDQIVRNELFEISRLSPF